MADRVKKVTYCHAKVSARAGQGVRLLGDIREADVNLLAFSGFPAGRRKAQLDFIVEHTSDLRRAAKKNGWRLSKPKKAFLVTGSEKLGAVHRLLTKLADKKINVTAATAVCAGKGRYGMILWVNPKDYRRASRTLRAK